MKRSCSYCFSEPSTDSPAPLQNKYSPSARTPLSKSSWLIIIMCFSDSTANIYQEGTTHQEPRTQHQRTCRWKWAYPYHPNHQVQGSPSTALTLFRVTQHSPLQLPQQKTPLEEGMEFHCSGIYVLQSRVSTPRKALGQAEVGHSKFLSDE